MATMRAEIPQLVAGAQASAERILEKPAALLNVPYWEQPSVAEELVNRSGGLVPLAHIDQSWEIGDADVPLRGPSRKMAPISGLNAVLIQRMLDDEVATRLSQKTSGFDESPEKQGESHR